MIIDGFPDSIITVKNKEYLYFGGTSYLGMATHPKFQQLLFENIKKWGTFYGSSRSANVTLSIYKEAEEYFAEFVGAESSLAVSSGTLAGKLVIEQLAKTEKRFFHYPKSHPAILTADSLPLIIDGKLHPQLCDNQPEEVVITADAILSLEVTPTSFDFLTAISPAKKITLLVDESHSLGVVGEHGEGIFNTIDSKKIDRKILISSLSKGLGLAGGMIASDTNFIEILKKEPSFVSASGASPAYLATYLDAVSIYAAQRQKLKKNLAFLFSELNTNESYIADKAYPVIYSNDDTIFTKLLQDHIVITSFAYPTYKKAMNRIVITANHTQQDLIKLIKRLNNEDR